jgi:hypothetical protein
MLHNFLQFWKGIYSKRWSQWSHGLRYKMSSLPRTLGSCIRISLKAHGYLCAFILFVLFCVQVTVLWRADPPPMESYRLCIGLRNWQRDRGPTKGLYSHRQICSEPSLIRLQLTRVSDNPERNLKNDKFSPQVSTYFKRRMAFRKADESLVCSDKTSQFLKTCIITFKSK